MIDQAPTDEVTAPEKHSGMGIASFALSLVAGGGMFVVFAVAGVLQARTPGGLNEQSAEAVIIGLSIFAFGGLLLLAIGLGIAGYFQKNRKSLFAILGSAISLLVVLAAGGLMLIGLLAS